MTLAILKEDSSIVNQPFFFFCFNVHVAQFYFMVESYRFPGLSVVTVNFSRHIRHELIIFSVYFLFVIFFKRRLG